MITLYTFGPFFGCPDASPFVMKGEMLLKIAGLPYETNTRGFPRAPKGKLPYILDEATDHRRLHADPAAHREEVRLRLRRRRSRA